MTFETNTNVGATLARLSLGIVLLAHGLLPSITGRAVYQGRPNHILTHACCAVMPPMLCRYAAVLYLTPDAPADCGEVLADERMAAAFFWMA